MRMSHRKKIFAIAAVATFVGLGALYGAIVATSAYIDNQYTSLHQGCSPRRTTHLFVIENDIVQPSHTIAARCDTLTIKNMDDVDRMMAFGVHDHHMTYDGIETRDLLRNQSFSVTLTQTGSFTFHDHMNDEVSGTFEVQ